MISFRLLLLESVILTICLRTTRQSEGSDNICKQVPTDNSDLSFHFTLSRSLIQLCSILTDEQHLRFVLETVRFLILMAAYVEMTLFWAAGDVGKLLTTRYNTTDDNTLRFQIALRCVSRPLREEEHSDKTVSGATP